MVAGFWRWHGSAAQGSGTCRDVVKSDFIRNATEIHRLCGPGKRDNFRSPVAEIWPGVQEPLGGKPLHTVTVSARVVAECEKRKAGFETARNVHYLA